MSRHVQFPGRSCTTLSNRDKMNWKCESLLSLWWRLLISLDSCAKRAWPGKLCLELFRVYCSHIIPKLLLSYLVTWGFKIYLHLIFNLYIILLNFGNRVSISESSFSALGISSDVRWYISLLGLCSLSLLLVLVAKTSTLSFQPHNVRE